MSPVVKIAWRRLRRGGKRGLVAIVATLISQLLIAFFVGFAAQLATGSLSKGSPANAFFMKLQGSMTFSAVVLSVLSLISIRIRCRGRREENRQVLAILTSIGASSRQRSQLLTLEFAILYAPAVILGSLVGCYPGMQMAATLSSADGLNMVTTLAISLMLTVIGLFLAAFCYFLPPLHLDRASLIGSVRRQKRTVEAKHGYRNSRTFRGSALIKRLAKKSVDYYNDTYGGIALGFFLTIMYPLMTILLIFTLGDAEIVLDINPGDSIDTTGSVLSAVNKILYFLIGAFSALTAAGFLQAFLMARDQILRRRESAKIYRTVGMTEDDVNRLISYELRSVALRVFVYLVVGTIVVNTFFSVFT
jgi:predicted lysophospholipase L1 biosynthesis ABC-type transport system permease subunit